METVKSRAEINNELKKQRNSTKLNIFKESQN